MFQKPSILNSSKPLSRFVKPAWLTAASCAPPPFLWPLHPSTIPTRYHPAVLKRWDYFKLNDMTRQLVDDRSKSHTLPHTSSHSPPIRFTIIVDRNSRTTWSRGVVIIQETLHLSASYIITTSVEMIIRTIQSSPSGLKETDFTQVGDKEPKKEFEKRVSVLRCAFEKETAPRGPNIPGNSALQ